MKDKDNDSSTHLATWRKLELTILTPQAIYNLFLNDKLKNLQLDNIIIDYGAGSFSSAEICYSKIKFGNRKIDGIEVIGQPWPARLGAIETILKLVAYRYARNNRNETIRYFLCTCVSFTKLLKPGYFPSSLEEAKQCLVDFLDVSREKIRTYIPRNDESGQKKVGISPNTISTQQNHVIEWLCEHIGCYRKELVESMKLFRSCENIAQKAKPLSEQELVREFNFYTTFFRELASIILEKKTLPTQIFFKEKSAWIAPCNIFICHLPESEVESRSSQTFNYEAGKFYSPATIIENGWSSLPPSMIKWNNARKLDTANKEHSGVRKKIAQAALQSYFMHFLIITGMNDSVAASLPWNSDYTVVKQSHYFRSIKYRANHQPQEFEIQSEFVDDFHLFLRLRQYLLDSEGIQNFNALFIHYNTRKCKAGGIKPLEINGTAGTIIRKRLAKKAPFRLNPNRVFRVTKAIWIRKRYGGDISAYVLQHNISTSMKSYSGSDRNTTGDEFTAFFESFNKMIHAHSNSDVQTNSGSCSAAGDAKFSSDTPDIFKECGRGEGCLFCENYRLQLNKYDFIKLLSLKYVILQYEAISFNNDHFQRVYGPVLERIELILSSIAEMYPNKQSEIDEAVDTVFKEEKLFDFWASKLALAIDLGVL